VMVFLLHVGRLPLAISRIVSRNRILCEAALSLGRNLKWNHLEKSIKLVLVRNYKVYTISRAQMNASNIVLGPCFTSRPNLIWIQSIKVKN